MIKYLFIWRKGLALLKSIFTIQTSLPPPQEDGINFQIKKRAALISACVSDNKMPSANTDWKYVLKQALGSSSETQTYLLLLRDFDYGLTREFCELEFILEDQTAGIEGILNNSNKHEVNLYIIPGAL